MAVQVSQFIVLAIIAVGAAVWLSAVVLWLMTRDSPLPEPLARRLSGKDVTHVRDALSRAAALQTPLWELEGGDETGALFALQLSGRPLVQIEVEPDDGNAARATARITRQTPPTWYRWLMASWLFLLLPAILTAAAVLMLTQVATHEDPNVRSQVFQTAHIVHFLWPPFMFWGIRRATMRMARDQCERFLTTLELL